MSVSIAPVSEKALTLRQQMSGPVLLPSHDGYETARIVWNGMIDRRPALIARCTTTDDVIAALAFSRENELPFSVRGGGHNVAGNAVRDDGLMIDLSLMKRIEIDPTAQTARVEPGVLWEEFDRATAEHGLATTGGVVGSTGIAGLTLGGGQGWLAGRYGMTIDNLLTVEIVTADGQRHHASANEHPDLFWAIRGAGANFGIVTSFTYQLHQVSTVLGGMVIHPLDRARDVLRFYRDFAVTQPDDLTTYAAILTGPDGNPIVALVACFCGDITEGEHRLAPLRGYGQPLVDTIDEIPYPRMQGLLGPSFPYGRRNYWKSGLTNRISDTVIDALVDFGGRFPSPFSAIAIADVHGAAARVTPTATAYYHRELQFDVLIFANWIEPGADATNLAWTRDLYAAIEPELAGAAYVNDLGNDGRDGVHRAYGGNYERLTALKRRYDPENRFDANQNIPPATLCEP